MIQDTIDKLQERLRSAQDLSPEKRAELELLLAELRSEIAGLPKKSWQRETTDKDDLLNKLRESVIGFEATHPQLVDIVNRISTILANMGI